MRNLKRNFSGPNKFSRAEFFERNERKFNGPSYKIERIV